MQTSRKWLKALLSLFILLFVVYIGFSDSRNGLLSLGIGMTAFVFFSCFIRNEAGKSSGSILCGVGGWHCVLSCAAGNQIFLQCSCKPGAAERTAENTGRNGQEGKRSGGGKDAVQKDTAGKIQILQKSCGYPTPKPKKPAEKVERNYSMEGDISNRRLISGRALWRWL